MPLTSRQFIEKRTSQKEHFTTHTVPQMNYLEANMRAAINYLENQKPKNEARIAKFKSMADAVHTVAHSHDSVFNREATLQNALSTLNGLTDFLEENDGENIKLLNQAAEVNPELMNDLTQQDKFKGVIDHVKDISNFCELDNGRKLYNRANVLARERFEKKIYDSDKTDTPFRNTTGKQINFLAHLYQQAAEDLEKEGVSYSKTVTFTHVAGLYSDLQNRGNLYMDEGVVESRLDSLRRVPDYMEENDGEQIKILRETLKKHPELKQYLPDDARYQNMTLAEHIGEVGGFFELKFEKKLRDILGAEEEAEKKEMEEAARLQAEREERKRQEQLDAEEAELANQVKEEENQAKQEAEAERKAAEDLKAQQDQRRAQELEENRQFREQNGAFVLPPKYDNRDAAGAFINSAKVNGAQYNALKNFTAKAGAAVRVWNEYTEAEYNKRLPDAMKDLPVQPSEEQMNKAVNEAIDSVPAEEREQHLRGMYPDYEQRLAAEQAKLQEGADPLQAQKNLYRQAVTEQYRDDLRKKTYTAQKIQEAEQEAALELAREDLEKEGQDAKQKFEQEKQDRSNDTIAHQIKQQIIEGFREKQSEFVFRLFPSDYSRDNYMRSHRHLYGLQGEALNKALYETRLGELVDLALHDKGDWDGLNRLLQNTVGVPKSMKDPQNPELGPLDVALKRAKEAPIPALTEKEMLTERSKDIPKDEIIKRTEAKLPVPQSDDQLIYGWARQRKDELLKEEISRDREKKFPETAKVGISELNDMYKQSRKLLETCSEVLPEKGEDDPVKMDYEDEVKKDNSLNFEQKKLLQKEYKNHLEEARKEQERKIHPKLMTKDDQELKNKIEREAALRQGMSEDEKRIERMNVLKDEREANRKKRIFRKDFSARLKKAENEKKAGIEEAKNKKIEGKLTEAGEAAAALFGKLSKTKLSEGELGKAYDDLDKALTGADLADGKALREKLGVEPEKKPQVQNGPKDEQKAEDLKKDEPKVENDQQEEQDLESSIDGNEELNYTVVEDDVFFTQPKNEQQAEENIIQQEPKVDENDDSIQEIIKDNRKIIAQQANAPKPKKLYVFQPEYIEAQKKAAEEEQNGDLDLSGEEEYTELDKDDPIADAEVNQMQGNVPQLWNSVRNNPRISQDLKDWHLSTILAVNRQIKLARKEQSLEPLNNDNIEKEAEKIRNSVAYKELFGKDKPNYLADANADKFMADYEKNARKIAAYRIPKSQQEKLAGRLGPVVQAMDSTGSGKIIKFVPRWPLGNSTGYENALAAIRTVKDHEGQMSAEEIYSNTQIVLNYLDGKEKVRTRAFGRERWNQCMNFLKHTMPPEKFKEYCDKINEKRGVVDDPTSEKYVSPECFGSTVHKEACEETIDMIERGKERPEDYATLLALRNMDPTQPVDKRQLIREKERIMQDEHFQFLVQKDNLPHLRKLAVQDGGKDYTALSNSLQGIELQAGPVLK